MSPTVPVQNEIEVKRNLFDLEKFERVSKVEKLALKSVKTMDEALEAVGADETELVKVFNVGHRRIQIANKKAAMGGENLVSPKAVSGIVNTLKPLYPAKDDTKEARAEQTKQVYAHIKRTPALLEAAKAIAKAFVDAAMEDDDDENEGDTV